MPTIVLVGTLHFAHPTYTHGQSKTMVVLAKLCLPTYKFVLYSAC
jgi:hypothetical protein